MTHEFRETTSESWFSRIKGAFSGIIIGLLLFLGSFGLLFWNEGRAVQTHKTLQEGAAGVASIDSERIDPTYDGKLVHISGLATTSETVSDPEFNISVKALRLERQVEMLQWKEKTSSETKKKLGGGTETVTTYSYSKEWAGSLINSANFRHPDGHQNPSSFPIESLSNQAGKVSVGAFTLTPGQISRINKPERLALKKDNRPSKSFAGKGRLENGVMFFGSKSHQKVGDLRVIFEAVYPTQVSIIAKQSGEGLIDYKADAGGTINMLSLGNIPAESMFKTAITQNKILTWVLRVVGLIVMFIGLKLILRVFSVIADVVPLFGNIVGAGTSLIAFLIALCLSLVTIAIAWLYYRPLLGGTLLVIAIGIAIYAQTRVKKAAPAEVLMPD